MYSQDKAEVIDRREMLRVKLKTLAAEARIIRHEINRLRGRKTKQVHYKDHRGVERTRTVHYGGHWGVLQSEMHLHRLRVVRDEARHTGIAFALVRGKPIPELPHRWGLQGYAAAPNWDRVRGMIKRYGPKGFVEPAVMALDQKTVQQVAAAAAPKLEAA